ncbi:MAG: SDR family NAD(P)-dependent oxidoreductase [Rhodospirillales bacterium]
MSRGQPGALPGDADFASGLGRVGVVEWFRPGEHDRVEQVLAGLASIGVQRLRTGISWADYHRDGGAAWYGWLLPRLARDVEILPCFTYTPPSLGVEAKASSPPRDAKAYADFLDVVVSQHGRAFEWVELWNEPNNLNNWDWQLDFEWQVFSEMVGAAAYWMRSLGKKTVLGGTCPTDPHWLHLMCQRGVMAYIDAIGVHGFPGTWDSESAWRDWPATIAAAREAVGAEGYAPQIWITEAGFSTWRHDEAEQLRRFVAAMRSEAERVYWYSYQDLHPDLASEEGFHFDERHYHAGMVRADGSGKLLYRALARGCQGASAVARTLGPAPVRNARPGVLITGGAGFIGANIADRLARAGEQVIIFDALARDHVEENVGWLLDRHGGRVSFVSGDVRDPYAVQDVVARASRVFHLAAQVAVTTSLADPRGDFAVNAGGTLNVLEAIRRRPQAIPLVFASTNKVYGHLETIAELRTTAERTQAVGTFARGFDETLPLDFYSPYGCSKGAADQYVLDYARIYDIPAAVFRMSCIYGPRQFGTEDQGWVAHFLIAALQEQPITIYGDGRQVRDILFVDDVVDAFLLAHARIGALKGRAFNIGGGPGNTMSLLELIALIETLTGAAPEVGFAEPRPGDQRLYVSDTARFTTATGWRPRVGVEEGVRRLLLWLDSRFGRTSAARVADAEARTPALAASGGAA